MSSLLHTRPQLRPTSTHTIRGFTLVEIMVALTIGLIILAAVAQIFATSRATYGLEENLARVQENGRFAMEFITQDVRMAGYAGCVNINQALNPNAGFTVNNTLNNPNDFATNLAAGAHIEGYDHSTGTTWAPALPAGVFAAGEVLANTDVVVIRRGTPSASARVTPPYMPTPAAALQLATGNGLSVDDIVMITDCESVDIFQITGPDDPDLTGTLNHNPGAGSPGNATQALSKTYGADSEILKMLTTVYYISTGAGGGPALFRKDMDDGAMPAAGDELVPDVESMQILYGEDTNADGGADIYRLPAAVADWSRVVSVRISLLVRTPDESGADFDTNTYTLVAGGNFDPVDDRRQRRVFSSTIQIRNVRTD